MKTIQNQVCAVVPCPKLRTAISWPLFDLDWSGQSGVLLWYFCVSNFGCTSVLSTEDTWGEVFKTAVKTTNSYPYSKSCADFKWTHQHLCQLRKDPCITINISEVAEVKSEMLRPVFLTQLSEVARQTQLEFLTTLYVNGKIELPFRISPNFNKRLDSVCEMKDCLCIWHLLLMIKIHLQGAIRNDQEEFQISFVNKKNKVMVLKLFKETLMFQWKSCQENVYSLGENDSVGKPPL